MGKESALQELQKLVSHFKGSILYRPTKTEVDYNVFSFPLKIPTNNLLIPKDKDNDPFGWAASCTTKFKSDEVYILIPGARFDVHGTRHGKGGGWYDRFLSKVPSIWLRIGIIDKSMMSQSKLLRQEWDESVNWIIVQDGFSWSVYKTQIL